MPDYDFYLDTSVCQLINEVKPTTPLRGVLYRLFEIANTTQTNLLLSPECYNMMEVSLCSSSHAQNRLFVRTNYRITSLLLSVFYILPVNLHFFMGTPYMSETPFTVEPSQLDVGAVGYHLSGDWHEPGNKFSKYSMLRDLWAIRRDYMVCVGRAYELEQLQGAGIGVG